MRTNFALLHTQEGPGFESLRAHHFTGSVLSAWNRCYLEFFRNGIP